MKITIATGPTFPVPAVRGGAVQRMWHGLAKEFAKRGHEVTILARAYPGQPENENSDGIRIVRWGGYDQGTNLRADLLRCLWYAVRAAGKLPEGDIVVTNDFWMPVFAARKKEKSGKVVINANRFPKGQYGLYGGADLIAAASRAVAQAIELQTPKLKNKIRILPNPVEEAFLRPREDIGYGISGQRDSGVKGLRGSGNAKAESEKRKAEKSVKFLFAGKFIPKKRVMDLLEAAAGVPEARVVLVGDGPLRGELEQRARQSDLMEEADRSPFAERVRPLKPPPAHSGVPVPGKGDSLREGIGRSQQGEYCHREGNMISRVLFAGFRNQGEMPAYLAAADCLVLPSDGTETWGLIVNEAMACGKPAIVSEACGCEPDLIVQGETGYTFPLGDTRALADCLRRFAAEKDRGWSEKVRAKIGQYSMEKATEGLARAVAARC